MSPVEVECLEDFGTLYTKHHRLQEIHLEAFLAEGLATTGWYVQRQWGFHGLRGVQWQRVPDRFVRTPDIYARRNGQHLIVECKWETPEHGVGQVLLAARLLERQTGHVARLALAAPAWCWHRELTNVCERVGVEAWPIPVVNGYAP